MSTTTSKSLTFCLCLAVAVMFLGGCGLGSDPSESQDQNQIKQEVLTKCDQAAQCQQLSEDCRETCLDQADLDSLKQAALQCRTQFEDCMSQQGNLTACGQGVSTCLEDLGVHGTAQDIGTCMQQCGQELGSCLPAFSAVGIEDLDELINAVQGCLDQSSGCLEPCAVDLQSCIESLAPELQSLLECVVGLAQDLVDCISQAGMDFAAIGQCIEDVANQCNIGQIDTTCLEDSVTCFSVCAEDVVTCMESSLP